MATCRTCGCTVSWDCECNPEYNRQLELENLKYELSTLSHGEDGIDNTAKRNYLNERINYLQRRT